MKITNQQKKIVAIIAVCIVGIILISPSTHKRIGDIFFGGVSKLYNVNLAQFFFTYAAYPPLGKPASYAHHQLSRTYFIKGNLERSVEEAYKEIEVYPEHWNTHYVLALTLGYMNREEEAIEAFGKFLEYKPESWAARNDRAWLQFRIGDIDGALETMEPVASYIDNPWVQNTYGTLLLNKKQYGEARIAFEHAQRGANALTEEMWGIAYPGNDPRVYADGLRAMRDAIGNNLRLVAENE